MADIRLKHFKSVPGSFWGTPKELWGFRLKVPGRPAAAADKFLRAHADLLGIEQVATQLSPVRVIESVGASHVLLQQQHRGVAVHRGYVTVHVAHGGEVFLVKNRAIPRESLPGRGAQFTIAASDAGYLALESLGRAARNAVVRAPVRRWYPQSKRVRAAYRFRVVATKPRREWLVFVDAMTGAVLEKWDNVAHANVGARVFDPNPVTAVPDWRTLLTPSGTPRRKLDEAYRTVTLEGLKPGTRLDGTRASTRLTRERVRRTAKLDEQKSTAPGFLEVMAYYHVDRVVAYLESLGYQGRRAIFTKPVPINAHGTDEDNSWYSPELRGLYFGTGGVDDAEDAEVIVHELGHAVQDAICPDFGQTAEAAAMGEGFGDYLAASCFASRKPPALRACVMSWDAVVDGGDPPCQRRLDECVTYESFDHRPGAREHENGKIWSATLWDIWNAVGRDVADRIILESHFQLDAFTRLARGARASLDADRNLFAGSHVAALRRIFHARGIGPVE
ncbi:MAG: M36 family metallopeptidase [Deltaproteobacteria bacterium]|nr:M36 family metallopeptidase [Deltaproteobacteria bacterium]